MHKNVCGFKLDDKIRLTDIDIFSISNKNYIVSRETGGSILLDNKLTNDLINNTISEELWIKLVQRGVALHSDRQQDCTNQMISFFLIDITQKCNLTCSYCFRDKTKNTTISDNTLDSILDKIVDYCKSNHIKYGSIQAWGGEPLLALDKIIRIFNFLKEAGLHFSIDVETNGTCLNKDTTKKLHDMGIHIGISIDGDEVNHNSQRPYCDNTGSYIDVVSGIRNTQEIYGKSGFGTICVLTKNSIKDFDKILHSFVYDLGIVNLKFNIVRDNNFARCSNLSVPLTDITHFANELFDGVISICNSGILINEATIMDRIRNIVGVSRNNCCNSRGCQGGKKIISFASDGEIYPCEIVDFKEECIGNINDPRQINEIISASYNKNRYFAKKHANICDECPWISFCKGGCTSRVMYLGKYGEIDEVECELNRTLYPRIVELILEKPEIVNKLLAYEEKRI